MLSGSEDRLEAHLATLNVVYVVLDSAGTISHLDRRAASMIQADVLEYAGNYMQELQLCEFDPDCNQLQLAIYFTVCAILARLRGRAVVPFCEDRKTAAAPQEVLAEHPLVQRIFAEVMNSIGMESCVAGPGHHFDSACWYICLSVCLPIRLCLCFCI